MTRTVLADPARHRVRRSCGGCSCSNPGYVSDMNAYKRWALRASQEGIAPVYATSDMDYPPLYAWILAPIGTDLRLDRAARARRSGPTRGRASRSAQLEGSSTC